MLETIRRCQIYLRHNASDSTNTVCLATDHTLAPTTPDLLVRSIRELSVSFEKELPGIGNKLRSQRLVLN